MVLERYSDAVIEYVTSPITGIQRKRQQPPSMAHVIEMCDDYVATQDRLARYRQMGPTVYRRQPRPSGPRYHLLVRFGRPGYERMVEKAATADPQDFKYENGGIWVPLTWWDTR